MQLLVLKILTNIASTITLGRLLWRVPEKGQRWRIMLWQQSKANPRALTCKVHTKAFDVIWHKCNLKHYQSSSEQRAGQWRLVQDSHLCSGTFIHTNSLEGPLPIVVAVMEASSTDCLQCFSCAGWWNMRLVCGILSSVREGIKKRQTAGKYLQNTWRSKRFSCLRAVYGGTEGKILDLAASIQELCSHDCFHFRMAGVKDHVLYPPQALKRGFGSIWDSEKAKRRSFPWTREGKDTKGSIPPPR